ncbi:carbonic anhydrase [Actinomycetota bacterium]
MKKIPESYEFNGHFSGRLAIFCSDERFIEANLAFLKNSLKIQTGDLMVLPGGPVFIINDEPDLMERLRILIEAHKIKQVVLISHSDCSYYKKKLKDLSEKDILEKQMDDIQKAINKLEKLFKDISVHVFHTEIKNSKTINYIQIT